MASLPLIPIKFFGTRGDVLGSGTYGVIRIYRNPQPELSNYGLHEQCYALKFSRGKKKDDPSNEVLKEFVVASRIQHPRLATAIAYTVYQEKIVLVFDVYQTNLFNFAKRTLPWEVKEQLARDVIEGLAVLHTNNISHNDLSTGNILVETKDGVTRAFICDFGSSELRASQGESYMLLTTLCYRPPEKFSKRWISNDFKFDIWSLGCVLYEIFAGSRLFPYDNEDDMMAYFTRKIGNPNEEEQEFLSKLGIRMYDAPASYISQLARAQSDCGAFYDHVLSCLKYIPEERTSADTLMSKLVERYSVQLFPTSTSEMNTLSAARRQQLVTYMPDLVNYHLRLRGDEQNNPGQCSEMFEDKIVTKHLRLNDIFYLAEYVIRFDSVIVKNKETISSMFYVANAMNGTYFVLSELEESVGKTKVRLPSVVRTLLETLKTDMVPITSYDYLRWSDFYHHLDGPKEKDLYGRILTLMLASGLRLIYGPYEMYKLLQVRTENDVANIREYIDQMQNHDVWKELRLYYSDVVSVLFHPTEWVA